MTGGHLRQVIGAMTLGVGAALSERPEVDKRLGSRLHIMPPSV